MNVLCLKHIYNQHTYILVCKITLTCMIFNVISLK